MRIVRWILVLCGVVLFAYSFMQPAVREASASPGAVGMRGYTCATVTLVTPWGKDGAKMLHDSPGDYFSVLISGWINPAFVLVLIFTLIRPTSTVASVLCLLVVLMFAACWVIFIRHHFVALAGYYMWMGGVVLALAAARFRPKPQP